MKIRSAKIVVPPRRTSPGGAARCRRKFLQFFPKGFYDEKYISWERGYKWAAHLAWEEQLGREKFRSFLKRGKFSEIVAAALRIESRTNLLFSFEKMALRDAVKTPVGSKLFSMGLYDWLYGTGEIRSRFERWVEMVSQLPRRQTRVVTWPVTTVFGFIARPDRFIFLKPMVTKEAAAEYEYPFDYCSRPNWDTYADFLQFAKTAHRDLSDLSPRDYIDIQSFFWTLGSSEYAT